MKFFLLYIFCLITLSMQAQIQHGGRPIGVVKTNSRALKTNATPTIIEMPEIDSTVIFSEEQRFNKTLKFAYPFEVDLSPDNCGQWYVNADSSKVWQVTIRSDGARSINVLFDQFRLPEGGRLFIYNSNMSHVIGAFTSENNKPSGVLPTLPVYGDEIIIEYQEPAYPEFEGELHINCVNHDYTNLFTRMKVGYFGDAGSCENDVTCFTDEQYQKVLRSTVKLVINGSELMSGSLINNTSEDGTPYVITAAHGYEDYSYSADNTLFIFNYQVPQCYTEIEGTREQSVAGGTMLAYSPKVNNEVLDFALIQLSVTPPTVYQPYYAGWNRSSTSPLNTFCIHHPQGDVKKISFDNNTLDIGTFSSSGTTFYPNGHWNVSIWDDGATEGGSSGAGLFNPQGQLIGGLSGGSSDCSYPRNDYYFRFDLAWDTFTDSTQQLACWLDPANTNQQTIDGYESDDVSKTQRITHITDSSSVVVAEDGSSGNIAGNNALGITRFVEKFENTGTNQILGLYFIAAQGYPNSVVNTTIWTGTDLPETEIYNDALLVQRWTYSTYITSGEIGGSYPKDSLNMQENFIRFSSPITVTGNYFIGFEVDNSQQDYPFGLVLNHTNSDDNAYYYDTEWHSYQDLTGYNQATTLWINPVVMLIDSSSTVDSTVENTLVVYPNPVKTGELLTIEGSNINVEQLRLFDILGRIYPTIIENRNDQTTQLNVDKLSQGVYILVVADQQILFQKL